MSKNYSNSKSICCKVCQDAGLPESVYTTHRVKDASGKTTCHTLLNTECRFCFKKGHTAKFCDVLAKRNATKEFVQKKEMTKTVPKKQNQQTPSAFAVLVEDEEDEEEKPPKIMLPELCYDNEPQNPSTTNKPNWAAIAAKPKQEYVTPPTRPLYAEPVKNTAVKSTAKPAPWCNESNRRTASRQWAQWSDSEDEDEVQEVVEYAVGELSDKEDEYYDDF